MKRRIRRIRRALKRAGLYNAFHITLIAVLLTGFCVILFNVKEPEQEKEPEEMQAEVTQNPETMTQTAESIKDKYKVFDTMSEDWGSDDLEGFVFYDLPEQYADKGYFPEKMQIYTRCLCKQYDVPYALVLAIIEYESGYEFDKTGDGGQSKGYMQIYEKWHTDRMQKLGCTDLMNPYQNVRVGIDFLSYLLKKYGTIQTVLIQLKQWRVLKRHYRTPRQRGNQWTRRCQRPSAASRTQKQRPRRCRLQRNCLERKVQQK